MENSKEIQVLENGIPVHGVFFLAEGRKYVTDRSGIVTLTVNNPTASVTVSRLGHQDLKVPFFEMESPIVYGKSHLPSITKKEAPTNSPLVPEKEELANPIHQPKPKGIIEKHWGWGVAAAAAAILISKS